jgi:hypothetical protein
VEDDTLTARLTPDQAGEKQRISRKAESPDKSTNAHVNVGRALRKMTAPTSSRRAKRNARRLQEDHENSVRR